MYAVFRAHCLAMGSPLTFMLWFSRIQPPSLYPSLGILPLGTSLALTGSSVLATGSPPHLWVLVDDQTPTPCSELGPFPDILKSSFCGWIGAALGHT